MRIAPYLALILVSPLLASLALAQNGYLFDEFQDGILDPSTWSAQGPGVVTESGGRVHTEAGGQLTSVSQYDPDLSPLLIKGEFRFEAQSAGSPGIQIEWRAEEVDTSPPGGATGGYADARIVFAWAGGSNFAYTNTVYLQLEGAVVVSSAFRIDLGDSIRFQIKDVSGAVAFFAENLTTGQTANLESQLVNRSEYGDHVKFLSREPLNSTTVSWDWVEIQNERTVPFGLPETVTPQTDGPHSIAAVDIDGDGNLDCIVASRESDSIDWIAGDGAGGFGAQTQVTSNLVGPNRVHAVDLDQDGDVDLFAGGLSEIIWLENLGGGSFAPGLLISGGRGNVNSLFTADLDGDGDLDLISGSLNDDRIAWHENLGGGAFAQERLISQDADRVQSVHAADLDGDGDPDVISASEADDKIAWYENLGGGSFGSQIVLTTAGRSARSAFAADIDADGDVDVLSCTSLDGQVFWLENLGGGAFAPAVSISSDAYGAWDVHAPDLDGDGDLEAVIAANGKVVWIEHLGQGVFAPQRLVTNDLVNSIQAASADFDHDGDLDVVATSFSDNRVLWCESLILDRDDLDQDDDGLLDRDELETLGTAPMLFDTDGDGLGDGMELGVTVGTSDTDPAVFVPDADPLTTTDPLLADTDSGGVPDGIEDQNRDGGVDTWETDPNLGADEALAFYVSNLSPGQTVHFEVYNATPFQGLFPAYSVAGPGPTVLGIGVTVDLSQPINTLTPVLADIDGRASWNGPRVPGGINLGLPVWLQLVEIPFTGGAERVSNPILLPVGAN